MGVDEFGNFEAVPKRRKYRQGKRALQKQMRDLLQTEYDRLKFEREELRKELRTRPRVEGDAQRFVPIANRMHEIERKLESQVRERKKRLSDEERERRELEAFERKERKQEQRERRAAKRKERMKAESLNQYESQTARVRKEKYKDKRLQTLPGNRTCPQCGKIKMKSKQWVCTEVEKPICKSCFWKNKKGSSDGI